MKTRVRFTIEILSGLKDMKTAATATAAVSTSTYLFYILMDIINYKMNNHCLMWLCIMYNNDIHTY